MRSFTVRRSRADDAPAIHALRSHPLTRRHQPLIPGTVDALERALAERGSAALTPDQDGKVQWTIEIGGEPAGWISVEVTSRSHHNATLGYALAPHYHGQGVTSAAVLQTLEAIFAPDQLAIERLEAVAAVDNTGSRRVLEKCGFTYEGIARGYLIISGRRVDHARYARLRSD
mgnify:CR=1 FL=1|jgi:RimJ/RimL family protein N-acetyltransferase